jgi:hypothetical protein
MKTHMLMLACVAVASISIACAQDTHTATTAAVTTTTQPSTTTAPKPYVRPWKGIEAKAHECFTDAEDIEYHNAYIQAVKAPEVKAARQAAEDARLAAMIRVDPTLALALKQFAADMKTMNMRDAIAKLTPEDKVKYDRAGAAAYKDPTAGTAAQAAMDTIHATMVKIDPACAELDKRLKASYAAARVDFYKPAQTKAATKPATEPDQENQKPASPQ